MRGGRDLAPQVGEGGTGGVDGPGHPAAGQYDRRARGLRPLVAEEDIPRRLRLVLFPFVTEEECLIAAY